MKKQLLTLSAFALALTAISSANAGWFSKDKDKDMMPCEKRFMKIDMNEDGMLSKDEFVKHAEEMKDKKKEWKNKKGKGMGKGYGKKTPEERFNLMDTDNDGMVSKEEHKKWLQDHQMKWKGKKGRGKGKGYGKNQM